MKPHSIQKSSLFLTALGIALIALFSGCTETTSELKVQPSEEKSSELTVSEAFENLLVLAEQEREPSGDYLYELRRLNPYSQENIMLQVFDSIHPGQIQDVKYKNNTLYFIHEDSYLLYSYDGKTENVVIPGLSAGWETGMSDFEFKGDSIFYLQVACKSPTDYDCYRLYSYNVKTGENKLVLDQIKAEVNTAFMFSNHQEEEKDSIYLVNSGGDGGYASITIYSVNPDQPELTKIESHMHVSCDQNCTETEKQKNAAYEATRAKYLDLNYMCGNTTIETQTREVNIKNAKQDFTFSGVYLDCEIGTMQGLTEKAYGL